MKSLYLFALSGLLTAMPTMAQSKFDAAALSLINSASSTENLERTLKVMSINGHDAQNRFTFIVRCDETIDLTAVEAAGGEVEEISSTCFLLTATPECAQAVAALPGIVSINANKEHRVAMDLARPATHVDDVHNGTGLPQAYTGEGVIVGLMDTGVDPGHTNFFDTETGYPRVMRYWLFNGTNGAYTEFTEENAFSATTNDDKKSHGTHVAGIMAGSYDMHSQQIATINERGMAEIKKGTFIPFRGMAPKSDIVMAAGLLSDANILRAAKNSVEYAESVGKPIVFNLSLGSNYGPHDGTDAATAELSKLGERAIICISAGNEGVDPLAIRKDLTEEHPALKTFVKDNTAVGTIDTWSSDATPHSLSWVVYDSSLGEVVSEFPADLDKPGQTVYYGNSNKQYISTEKFNDNFKGFVSILTQLDPNNNRWNTYCTANIEPKTSSGRYRLGIIVKGENGQHIDLYGNESTTFTSQYLEGWDDGQFDGTINGMACGQNMIAVGSYCTRSEWAMLNGQKRQSAMSNGSGNISYFSSWGHLLDGRTLPHICAPGEMIVSSYSTPYVQKQSASDKLTNSATALGVMGTTNYWGTMQGTSMASPAVAGIIALWLQANPSLTYADVMGVLKNTAVRDEAVTSDNPARWGYGKIDALAGLKYVLTHTALELPSADSNEDPVITVADGLVDVFHPSLQSAALYNVQGMRVAETAPADNQATIATGSLTPGVYILQATTATGSHSSKIAIK